MIFGMKCFHCKKALEGVASVYCPKCDYWVHRNCIGHKCPGKKIQKTKYAVMLAIILILFALPLASAQFATVGQAASSGKKALIGVSWGIFYGLIGALVLWMIWYRMSHKIPVEITDLKFDNSGNVMGMKKKDLGAIFKKRKVSYLHLFWRFRVKYLRDPLPHEKDYDGGLSIIKITNNFYAYAPKRLFLIKKLEGGDEKEVQVLYKSERDEEEKTMPLRNILLKRNKEFKRKEPLSETNQRYIPVTDPSIEFSEVISKQFIDESQKDSFRVDFRNVLERTYRPKDTTVAWVGLGLFAINAIIFIMMLIFSRK